jgi:tetratricopeptide (TPR) repeat protein
MAPHDDVARRYAAVARLALERGNPSRSATYEEMASELAESDDRAGSHLAHSAALWTSVGDHERALANLDRADRLSLSSSVRGELDYRRARLAYATGNDTATTGATTPAEAMRAAAELCLATSPHRAALMLVDSVACDLLHSSPAGAVATARRALELASGVNSHVEALAQATLTAAHSFEGRPAEAGARDWRWTMVLDSLTQGFSASPHLAYVIGEHLMLEGRRSLATHWAQAIGRCASSSGNRSLASASSALLATLSLSAGSVGEARTHAEAALVHADRQLAARVLATLTVVHAAAGRYRQGFETASQLFALSGDVGRVPRLQARVSLANLELQARPGSSASAWLASAWEEVTSRLDERRDADPWDAVCARWARRSPR